MGPTGIADADCCEDKLDERTACRSEALRAGCDSFWERGIDRVEVQVTDRRIVGAAVAHGATGHHRPSTDASRERPASVSASTPLSSHACPTLHHGRPLLGGCAQRVNRRGASTWSTSSTARSGSRTDRRPANTTSRCTSKDCPPTSLVRRVQPKRSRGRTLPTSAVPDWAARCSRPTSSLASSGAGLTRWPFVASAQRSATACVPHNGRLDGRASGYGCPVESEDHVLTAVEQPAKQV